MSAWEHLPLQRRDRPGLATGSLTVLRVVGRAYHRGVSIAVVRRWDWGRTNGVLLTNVGLSVEVYVIAGTEYMVTLLDGAAVLGHTAVVTVILEA